MRPQLIIPIIWNGYKAYRSPNWPDEFSLTCIDCGVEKSHRQFTVVDIKPAGVVYGAKCRKCRARFRQWYRKDPLFRHELLDFLTKIHRGAASGAQARKLEFEIDLDDVAKCYFGQRGLCAISGVPMTYSPMIGSKTAKSNISIDRVNSDAGYLPSNIQLVCYAINIMKSDMLLDELRYWCAHVVLAQSDEGDEEDA